jgi:hypothetical protein
MIRVEQDGDFVALTVPIVIFVPPLFEEGCCGRYDRLL